MKKESVVLYYKSKNITYTQMAIWIDDNAYKEDCDQEKLFKYLYLLCDVFAYKWRYFSSSKEYDDFSIFSASILFQRYKRDDMQPIKSIMNYLKKVLYAHRAQYQKQFCRENITEEVLKDYDTRYDVSLEYELSDRVSGLNKCEFAIYLDDIPKTIVGSIQGIPKKRNSYEYKNIEMSCLLTFLDLITLSNEQKNQLKNINRSDTIKTNLFLSLYKIPKDYKAVLYHLDESYNDYILFLVNKVRIQIKNDLKDILYSQVSIQDLYADAIEQFGEDDDKSEY